MSWPGRSCPVCRTRPRTSGVCPEWMRTWGMCVCQGQRVYIAGLRLYKCVSVLQSRDTKCPLSPGSAVASFRGRHMSYPSFLDNSAVFHRGRTIISLTTACRCYHVVSFSCASPALLCTRGSTFLAWIPEVELRMVDSVLKSS